MNHLFIGGSDALFEYRTLWGRKMLYQIRERFRSFLSNLVALTAQRLKCGYKVTICPISILGSSPSVLRLIPFSVEDVPDRVRNSTALWVTGILYVSFKMEALRVTLKIRKISRLPCGVRKEYIRGNLNSAFALGGCNFAIWNQITA